MIEAISSWVDKFFLKRSQKKYLKKHKELIAKEVLTDNITEAQWIVYQMDGKIRFVVRNLYARCGDIAQSAQAEIAKQSGRISINEAK